MASRYSTTCCTDTAGPRHTISPAVFVVNTEGNINAFAGPIDIVPAYAANLV